MKRQLDEGLILVRESCPIGVIGVIFEARPDALVQISTLCIKSGNCALLKGGSETFHTNRALFSVIHDAAVAAGLPELCLYPGGLNRRVRWESATSSGDVTPEVCGKILSLAQPSIAEGVKLAKNALKDPLSAGEATILLPFTAVEFAEDGHGVLICGSERIALCNTNAAHILKLIAGKLSGGAMLCNLCYLPETHRIVCEPMSIVTKEKIIRLNDAEVIRMS